MKHFLLVLFLLSAAFPARAAVMTHVNAAGTVNCGYVEYEPALRHDPKSGIWAGFDYEIMQAIANRLDLKADFVAATSWGTVVEDLNASKFDMLCSTFWVHPNVAKFALFSRDVYFQPVFVVARVGDNRIRPGVSLDNPEMKMSALDGDNPVAIAKADFPRTQILTLPNVAEFSQVLLNVADGKADFTIVDAMTFGTYVKNNPGKLRIVDPQHPIRVYPASYAFRSNDVQFRDAVNAALDELILDGTIDRILNRYDSYPNAYYRAVVPFRNPYTK